ADGLELPALQERGAAPDAAALRVRRRALLLLHPADGGAAPAGRLHEAVRAVAGCGRSVGVRLGLRPLGLGLAGRRAAERAARGAEAQDLLPQRRGALWLRLRPGTWSPERTRSRRAAARSSRSPGARSACSTSTASTSPCATAAPTRVDRSARASSG